MRPFLSSSLLLCLSCCLNQTLQADELRYSPKEGALFGYEITIAIGGNPATASLTGRSTYRVESTGKTIALTEALCPLLKHENETIKSLAEQAWENWGSRDPAEDKKPAEE